jgi:hypothetical protein
MIDAESTVCWFSEIWAARSTSARREVPGAARLIAMKFFGFLYLTPHQTLLALLATAE